MALTRPRLSLTRPRVARTAKSIASGVALPLTRVLVSLAAVRVAGIETWGAFVALLLLVQLSAQVADWGSRDALLRGLSRRPAELVRVWQSAVITRAALLPLGPLLFLAAGVPVELAAWMTLWLLAVWVARMHDALINYRRAFGFALVAEAASMIAIVAGVLALGASLTLHQLVVIHALVAVGRAALLAVRFRVLLPHRWEGRADARELRDASPFFALTFSGAIGSRIDLYLVAALLPAGDVGRYQVLTGLVLVVQALAGAVLAPLVPSLYRLSREAVGAVSRRLALIGLVATPAAMAAAWLALIWLYAIRLPDAVLVVAWLATLPAWIYLPYVYVAFRRGRERSVLLANALGIAIAAAGTLLLAREYGIAGPMASSAAAQAAVALVLIRDARSGADVEPRSDDATREEVAHAMPGL